MIYRNDYTGKHEYNDELCRCVALDCLFLSLDSRIPDNQI
jgi:hypothetical protein